MDMKSKKDQFNHLYNKSMSTKPMRPTVKPVEPKRVYYSDKLKSRPATGSKFGSYHKVESSNTLSGVGIESDSHFFHN